ncbi:MAG: serine/threonine protein kinase [Acetatifactor sp.]|nr:serine/threonine protein kinase [Acetatifactor sp.]
MKDSIGGYKLMEELGAGATARVYRVREPDGGKVYALKYSAHINRLSAEAAILKQVRHPCFPGWIEDGREGAGAYLVMEYVPGITLQRLMEQYPAGMLEQMAAGIGQDVARGLAYLHGCQPAYIYRDLKAANVIITPEGRARLVDLGAAVCAEGVQAESCRAGTYGYSAPEQFWEGIQITPACDVYGLGKLLAFLLTGQDPGKPPYDTMEYCSRHCGIRRAFQQLLAKCLQPDPQLRYPDASFLLSKLEALTAGKGCFRDKIRAKTGNRTPCRYIKCIWRSEYERIF